MSNIADTVSNLIGQTAFMNLTWGNLIMILVAFVFLLKWDLSRFCWCQSLLVCCW